MLNKIKKFFKYLFTSEKLIIFKVGSQHLIGAYEPFRKYIRIGNPVYYDGSIFQRKEYGQKAIDRINSLIQDINSIIDFQNRIENYMYEDQYKMLSEKDKIEYEKRVYDWKIKDLYRLVNDYETIEKYEEIINIIKNEYKF